MLETNPQQLTHNKINLAQTTFELVPANNFSVQQLTDIYNQTRIDYVVPMPMNAAKMQEYITNYDIDLPRSTVAMANDEPLGLGLLGRRENKTWITRLGIIPNGRQGGVGRSVMSKLLDNSRAIGAEMVILEVIKNNKPAQRLFTSLGFETIRELLVIRRPPAAMNMAIGSGLYIDAVGYQEAVQMLKNRTDQPSWVTANQSLYHAGNLSALVADIPKKGRGWLVYQNTVFQLGRLVLMAEADDWLAIAVSLLQNLHWRHPVQDTIVENVPSDEQYWPAFQALGYLVSFIRVEMHLSLT